MPNPILLAGSRPTTEPDTNITLRDLFAAFSMHAHRVGEWGNTPDDIAHRAYADADAMLEEGSKDNV